MKKLAVVVGHNKRGKGAFSKHLGESEFTFNSALAKDIESLGRSYGFDVAIFFRDATLGYSRQIDKAYGSADKWGADLSVELHFNGAASASARGSCVLTSGSSGSFRFAKLVQKQFVKAMDLDAKYDRGVITRTRGARGGRSLHAGKAPAILTEPFFGSNLADCQRVQHIHSSKLLAHAILRGAQEALGVIPRKTLAESSTVKTAKIGGSVSGLVGAGGAIALVNEAATALPLVSEIVQTVKDNLPAFLIILGIAGAVAAYMAYRGRKNAWDRDK